MTDDRARPPSPVLAALACAAAALAVLSPVLDGGFLNWDDNLLILDNPAFRGLGWPHLKWMFSSMYFGLFMPLTWLSWAWDHTLWGLEPFGYHLTSLLVHGANAAAFLLVCEALFERAAPEAPAARRRTGAVFAALFFALHPLRVETVAWVTERSVLLCALFSLLGILSYLRAPERRGWTMVWVAAALLSKGSAVTLPLVFLVLDLYPLRRRWREACLEKVPFFLLAAGVTAVGWLGQLKVGAAAAWSSWGLMPRLCQACYGLGFYLVKTLWPSGLSPYYDAPLPMLLWRWPYWAGAVLALGLTAAALASARRRPAVPALWAFYLLALAPVAGLIKIGHLQVVAADHYSYFACLGWAAAAGLLLTRLREPGRRTALAAAGAVLAALSIQSFRQAAVWKDSASLWSAVLARDPGASIAHGCLGQALIDEQRWDEAVRRLQEQLRRRPGAPEDLQNLDAALSRREWRRKDPARYFNNIGARLAEQGRFEEAAQAFARSLQESPRLALTHDNMGRCLQFLGSPDQARRHLELAARLQKASGMNATKPSTESSKSLP